MKTITHKPIQTIDAPDAFEVDRTLFQVCSGCGCSDEAACPGGCYWVTDTLCSRCATAENMAGFVYLPSGLAVPRATAPGVAELQRRDAARRDMIDAVCWRRL